MDFDEPVVVYVAATNLEAHLIADLLQSNDVPAQAVEDVSAVGMWMGGTLPMIHRPKIWVDRKNAVAAQSLIATYEAQQRDRRRPIAETGEVHVSCEECGAPTSFPISLSGTVQECPSCRAYLDVGQSDWDIDVGEPEDENPDDDEVSE